MRRFYNPEMDKEETNIWMPVSNLLAAAMLVFLVVLIAVLAFSGSEKLLGQQSIQTAQPLKTAGAATGEEALKAREKALADKETALKNLAGTRLAMIKELSNKLSGLKLPIEIDNNTGNIRFTEAVLFSVNKDNLNYTGQQHLRTFVPAYLNVLLSSKNKKYMEQIIVEGHADNGGSYMYNLELSRKRAEAVTKFILDKNLARLTDGTTAEKYFTVSARSYNVPVLVNGKIDKTKSRRVEFVFRLKDDALLKQMQDISKGVK